MKGIKTGLLHRMQAVIDLQLSGFKHHVPPGSVGQLAFEPCLAEDWYSEFRNRIVAAMGKNYLPVYRMADGEFIFCVGRKPRLVPDDATWAESLRMRVSCVIAPVVHWLRPSEHTCWGERYSGTEHDDLMHHYVTCLRRVSEQGMLALHFVRSPSRFSEEYINPMCEWFQDHGVRIRTENYISFYFVYALLCGHDSRILFGGKSLLVVTAADSAKQVRITNALMKLGAREVQFLSISPNRSLLDKIDLAQVNDPVDIALVAAGIGSVNILDQLAPLKTVCIDAGICLECFADPSRREDRIFLKSDTGREG